MFHFNFATPFKSSFHSQGLFFLFFFFSVHFKVFFCIARFAGTGREKSTEKRKSSESLYPVHSCENCFVHGGSHIQCFYYSPFSVFKQSAVVNDIGITSCLFSVLYASPSLVVKC